MADLADTPTTPTTLAVPGDLRARVVREARRETWFVVNEGTVELTVLALELREGNALRRVDINGEVAEFDVDDAIVRVQARRALRPGAGTIVVLHFR